MLYEAYCLNFLQLRHSPGNLRGTIKLLGFCDGKVFNKFIHSNSTALRAGLASTKATPFKSHAFIYQSDMQSNNTIKLQCRKILENNSPFKFRREWGEELRRDRLLQRFSFPRRWLISVEALAALYVSKKVGVTEWNNQMHRRGCFKGSGICYWTSALSTLILKLS